MRRSIPVLSLLAVPALALTLAACGGGSTSVAASSAAPASAAPSASGNPDFAAYVKCLADHGVTLPSGGPGVPGGPGGFDRDGDHQPPAGAASGGASGMPAPTTSMDPNSMDPNTPPSVGGGDHPAPQGVDPSAWSAAEQACGDLGEMMRQHGDGDGHGDGDLDGDGRGPGDGDRGGNISLPPVASASPTA